LLPGMMSRTIKKMIQSEKRKKSYDKKPEFFYLKLRVIDIRHRVVKYRKLLKAVTVTEYSKKEIISFTQKSFFSWDRPLPESMLSRRCSVECI